MRSLLAGAAGFFPFVLLALVVVPACSTDGGATDPVVGDGTLDGGTADGAATATDDGRVTAAPASCTNATKDGTETDVDCGGACPTKCAVLQGCATLADCASGLACVKNACAAPTPSDGVKDGSETDVDCGGGPPAPACTPGKACVDGVRDCDSFVCTGGMCKAATGSDLVKNGNESDVDCGGTNTGAPRCAAGLLCNAHSDCASDGCAYDGRCAVERSCTKQLGGVTCGVGEVGEVGAVHESCCKTAPLAGSAVRIDKYHVTAGRMRAFIERMNGDVRTFAQGTAGWNAAWSPYVPSTVTEADAFLGPYMLGAANQSDVGSNPVSKRSCDPVSFGGHTYWTPASAGGSLSDYNASELDPKALNCVGWHLAKAFCAWDHGRLATHAEIVNAFQNGAANNTYPWQWHDNTTYNPAGQDPRLNHEFNYGYPGVARRVPAVTGTVQDIAWYVSPPGRFPGGRNANDVDIAGDLLHWIADAEYDFTWTFSWEGHDGSLAVNDWHTVFPAEPNGYYGIGFRCVH